MQVNSKHTRESSFELLRIVAMFFIVFYHLVTYYLYEIPDTNFHAFFTALLPTLHIGVILFVLISGYFGIKSTWRGLISLLLVILVYNLPFIVYSGIGHGRWTERLMFITNTPYWFIRCYIYLYLVAPFLNKAIEQFTIRERIGSLMAFGIVAMYFGSTQGDGALEDGKNLINFIFLYLVGNTLKMTQERWSRISYRLLGCAYIVLNASLILSLYFTSNSSVHETIINLSFPYRSPLLLINAVLVFMMFAKMRIHSRFINAIATSMFAVYIIHCQPMIHNLFLMKGLRIMLAQKWGGQFVEMLIYTCIIMVLCVLIDKCLTPYWNWQNKITMKFCANKKLF